MAYATQSDISPARLTAQQLIQLTCDDNSGAVNVDVVDAALNAASGIIENYCRERYTLPLKQTNELTDLAVDIALYKLYSRRGRVADAVRVAFTDAMALLKDISTKKASLDQPVGGVEQTPASTVVARKCEKVFTRENLEGFV